MRVSGEELEMVMVGSMGCGDYHKEEAEGVVELRCAAAFAGFEGGDDLEAAGGEDDAEGDPESAIRGESGGTKGVSDCHFPDEDGDQHLPWAERITTSAESQASSNSPHARKQLHQPTIPKRYRNDNIRLRHPPRPHINQTQHKCRERKRTQSQRRRIGNLAVLDLAVRTRLELSSKGGQTRGAVGLGVGERAIAEAGGGLGGLVLLVGHFALDAVVAAAGVVLLVEAVGAAVDALAGVLGVGESRHFCVSSVGYTDGSGY